jgi:hypothetical protein
MRRPYYARFNLYVNAGVGENRLAISCNLLLLSRRFGFILKERQPGRETIAAPLLLISKEQARADRELRAHATLN